MQKAARGARGEKCSEGATALPLWLLGHKGWGGKGETDKGSMSNQNVRINLKITLK